MKAKVKRTGKIVEVIGTIDTGRWLTNNYEEYYEYQLDFDVPQDTEVDDSDLRISVAKLREVLDKMKSNIFNDFVINKIINNVKAEL